jgi:hypothetical protein
LRLLAVLLLAVLAACGSSSTGGSSSSTAAGTSLTVTVWPDGSKPDHTTTTFTGAVTAADLAPVPSGSACTMIFGGPQKATITGTLDGQPVNASFERSNGCEIARWENLVKLGVLPTP